MTLNVDLMQDQELRGKRVLIREDLNVPIKNGTVTSDARIRAALPTIEMALAAGAKVIPRSNFHWHRSRSIYQSYWERQWP
jgi:phosphoglycerate kinase